MIFSCWFCVFFYCAAMKEKSKVCKEFVCIESSCIVSHLWWVKEHWKINQSDNEAFILSQQLSRKILYFQLHMTLVVRLIKCMLILLFIHYKEKDTELYASQMIYMMIFLLTLSKNLYVDFFLKLEFRLHDISFCYFLLKSFYFTQINTAKFLSQKRRNNNILLKKNKRRMIYENLLQKSRKGVKNNSKHYWGINESIWVSHFRVSLKNFSFCFLWSFDGLVRLFLGSSDMNQTRS